MKGEGGQNEGICRMKHILIRPWGWYIHIKWVLDPGEGGGGTASLKVGTHCQTTTPAFRRCLPLNLFLSPPIFEGHILLPQNQTFSIQFHLQN